MVRAIARHMSSEGGYSDAPYWRAWWGEPGIQFRSSMPANGTTRLGPGLATDATDALFCEFSLKLTSCANIPPSARFCSNTIGGGFPDSTRVAHQTAAA